MLPVRCSLALPRCLRGYKVVYIFRSNSVASSRAASVFFCDPQNGQFHSGISSTDTAQCRRISRMRVEDPSAAERPRSRRPRPCCYSRCLLGSTGSIRLEDRMKGFFPSSTQIPQISISQMMERRQPKVVSSRVRPQSRKTRPTPRSPEDATTAPDITIVPFSTCPSSLQPGQARPADSRSMAAAAITPPSRISDPGSWDLGSGIWGLWSD